MQQLSLSLLATLISARLRRLRSCSHIDTTPDATTARKGCITLAKRFRLSLRTYDKTACATKRGHMVTFHNILLKPKKTILVTK